MNNKKTIILISAVVIIACVMAAFFFKQNFRVARDEGTIEETENKSKRIRDGKMRKSGKVQKAQRILNSKGGEGVKKESKFRLRNSNADLTQTDEYKNLTPSQRKILDVIRQASDNDDKKALIELIHQLEKKPGWPSAFPLIIRREAVEALAWFDSDCLPEIITFIADKDADVAQMATDELIDSVSDQDMSDRIRAQILISSLNIPMDRDTVDHLLFELNNMRNSVAVDTVKKLWELQNKNITSQLADAIEFFTGEEGLDTPQKLDEWLENNPDDEGDEEFYGGINVDKE